MVGFIDAHRDAHGVEPICNILPIAPSTYYDHLAKRADPSRLSDRARQDEALRPEILRVFEENWRVYGVRKVWRQLGREGFDVARCTVARLMKSMGIQGVIRGKPHRTTIPDKKAPCPLDKVNRQFRVPAPNMLWVSDFTYVATWKGFVYVAFVIDAYARKIVGWRVSSSAHAGFVLDALEQAVHDRRPGKGMGLVHHSDRGSQYLSIRYTERLAEAGIEPSVGSVGDSYDNALAETINGLFKAEVIHRRGPWRSLEAVEYATLEWVDWFNNRRLLEPIGNIPPAEAEANFYAALETEPMCAVVANVGDRGDGHVDAGVFPVDFGWKLRVLFVPEILERRCGLTRGAGKDALDAQVIVELVVGFAVAHIGIDQRLHAHSKGSEVSRLAK
ncbi:Integrase core domain protein [Paracoccus haematequi]|uniref:Integrase core domain protein n=1 Tax=Paracoccus haematequi TaxID=2491866 RepID=A0A447ISL8_9RHOB|nr:Integrase core domain protein [Paracoccus haematequi]